MAAYFGDGNGDQSLQRPGRHPAAAHHRAAQYGFLAYPLADPNLLADITLNGQLQGNDVTSIQRAIVQIAVANIPPLPAELPAPRARCA